jgi:DEAD/DEAH box helicase domain-containing protein
VAVLAGYPGTIAATWQRAGRAGRRTSRSAAVLVASSAPLDQYVVRHPEYFFGASPEHALINPDNLHVLVDHVKCAAFELPFTEDESYGRENVQEILGLLEEEGFVHRAQGQWNWTNESYPADAVSLRSVSSDNFVIVDTTNAPRIIGETDYTSAFSTLHEKAIYIVEGQLYQVERLDVEGRKAYVREVDCDYYTDAITYTKVSILEVFESDAAGAAGGRRSHGEVHVSSRVVGFKKIKFYTNENVGSGELDLPEQEMHTTSYWLTVPRDLMRALPYGADDRRDGVIGLSFAMRQVAQLLLMCDRQDIGISIGAGDDTPATALASPAVVGADLDEPRVFVYDNYPGGIGFSEPLFGMHDQLLGDTRTLIAGCECDHGCPTCVGPVGESGPLAKQVALAILDGLLVPALEP